MYAPEGTTTIKSNECPIIDTPLARRRVPDKPRTCAKMYAQYCGPDPAVALDVCPQQLRVDPFGVVDGTGHVDNGLGFGQGSTAGVMNGPLHGNQYRCSGFQRPKYSQSTCPERNAFNMKRMCSSPYRCHLDTEPNCGIRY